MLSAREVMAQRAEVPATVQAQLISKVPAYDYEFKKRAGERVQVLILASPGNAESARAAALVHAALQQEKAIAGLPHTATIATFKDVAALASEVRARSISIVYLGPGLEDNLLPICAALEPMKVLTVSTLAEYVKRCAVLGFEVMSGRPRILVHLAHAQRSGIRFRSELLELATVYR
ncbi:MAG TPA: YfiR family protein [Polyangiaceae bacterium]|nr:YfiR family protein [Polyangiaceae bacterium]